ncbi:hypothetical protein [Sulfolobus islandicus]
MPPQILPQDALINKSAEEIEKLALEEAEKISSKYARGKEIKRKATQATASSKAEEKSTNPNT